MLLGREYTAAQNYTLYRCMRIVVVKRRKTSPAVTAHLAVRWPGWRLVACCGSTKTGHIS